MREPADEHDPQGTRDLEDRPLGVKAVGDDPQAFSRLGGQTGRPADHVGGLLELGLELPAVVAGKLADVFEADVELGQDRQADGPPESVPEDQGQRDPDVAVEVLAVGRARRGIVMDARSFHVRAVAFRGGVVQGHEQPRTRGQACQHKPQQPGGERFGLASHGGDEVIIWFPVVAHPGGPQPSGHGPSAGGEEHPREQDWQPPSALAVQPGRQPLDPVRPLLRTLVFRHPWLSGLRACFQQHDRDRRAFFRHYQSSAVASAN